MLSTNTHSHVHTHTHEIHISTFTSVHLSSSCLRLRVFSLYFVAHFVPLQLFPVSLLPSLLLPLSPLYSRTNFVVVCLILLLSKLPLPNAFANSLTLLFICRIAYTTCCTRRTILFFSSALIPLLFRLCVLCVMWHVLLVSRYDEFIPFCCHYRNCCSLFSCCSPSCLFLLLFVLYVVWVWVAVAVYFTQKPNRLFGTLL